jgi:hypothetical protein
LDKYEKRRDELLAAAGAKLVRAKKHEKYRFADGRSIVFSSTPSDVNATKAMLADVKRMLLAPARGKVSPKQSIPGAKSKDECSGLKRPENWPARLNGEVIIPSIGAMGRKQASDYLQFSSLGQLLRAADEVHEFWALSECGRIRVLQKLSTPFLNSEVQYILTLRLSDLWLNKMKEAGEFMKPYITHLLLLHCKDIGKKVEGRPALLIRRGKGNDPLLLASGITQEYCDYDQNVITPLSARAEGSHLGFWPLQLDFDELWHRYVVAPTVVLISMDEQFIRRAHIPAHICAEWSDAALIRTAIRNMLSKLSDPGFLARAESEPTAFPEDDAPTTGTEHVETSKEMPWQKLSDIAMPFREIASGMLDAGLSAADTINGMLYGIAQIKAQIGLELSPETRALLSPGAAERDGTALGMDLKEYVKDAFERKVLIGGEEAAKKHPFMPEPEDPETLKKIMLEEFVRAIDIYDSKPKQFPR